MNGVVVDASVAVKWYLTEVGSDSAFALLADAKSLHAPQLLEIEVANAFLKNVIKGLADATLWDFTRLQLKRSVGTWYQSGPLVGGAFEIACALSHPIYDCFYLALARGIGAVCVTADKWLLTRIAGTPYANLAVELEQWQGARV